MYAERRVGYIAAVIERLRVNGSTVAVTFRVPHAAGAQTVALCGDFNDWSPTSHPMVPDDNDGSFTVTVRLTIGRDYRFRYLIDGARWENDWAADRYEPNAYGGDDSVIAL